MNYAKNLTEIIKKNLRVPASTQSHEIAAQKVKFSINDFFRKYDQIESFLWIWSCLLKKALMENFIFCAANYFAVEVT